MMQQGVVHNGCFVTVAEMAAVAGVWPATIRNRMKKHPEWGYEELICEDARPKYYLTHNGKTLPVKEWARMLHVPYQTAVDRYKRGERVFERVFEKAVIKDEPLFVSEENMRWLRRTKKMREGQDDEWIIACDLIGISHGYADDLRRLMDDGAGQDCSRSSEACEIA